MLTSQQYATLKAHILASPELAALPNNSDGAFGIAALMNLPAAPDWTVWRTNVTVRETGKAFNGAEWAGMTSANHTRLVDVAAWVGMGYDASRSDIQAMFNDIWSGAGGATTRANLLVLWKRLATRAEKLFSTGTGSNAVPATMSFEGQLSPDDVQVARNS